MSGSRITLEASSLQIQQLCQNVLYVPLNVFYENIAPKIDKQFSRLLPMGSLKSVTESQPSVTRLIDDLSD